MAGFRKAKPEQAVLKIGIYGKSGSGKTFTTLLCAEGLASLLGKRIAYVDTERGTDFYAQAVKDRSVHPEAFDFDALYTPSLTETLSAVENIGDEHGIIVIDSMTHLWEAAINAYSGKTTKAGTIPFHAWGRIKAPYKRLVKVLLNCPQHVFILGREKNIWEEDEEGELKNVGTTMRAEGETPYEPHILIKMLQLFSKDGKPPTIAALAEKDRTGVLAGKVVQWPTYDKLIKPLLPLLGTVQAQMPDAEETAATDAEALGEADLAREAASRETLEQFQARIKLTGTLDGLKELGKEITPAVKKKMLTEDVTELRASYLAREKELS